MYSDESSDKLSDESEKLYRAVEIVQSAAHSNPRRSETDIPGGCLAPFTPRRLRIRLREDVVVRRRRRRRSGGSSLLVGILISKLPRRQITVDPNKASSPLTRGRQRFPGRGRGTLPRGGCFDKGCGVAPLRRFILPSRPFVKRALLTPSTSTVPLLSLSLSFSFYHSSLAPLCLSVIFFLFFSSPFLPRLLCLFSPRVYIRYISRGRALSLASSIENGGRGAA